MLMDLIRARRSVRDYKIKEVPHGLITEVIEAARFAPSGCNAAIAACLISVKSASGESGIIFTMRTTVAGMFQ